MLLRFFSVHLLDVYERRFTVTLIEQMVRVVGLTACSNFSRYRLAFWICHLCVLNERRDNERILRVLVSELAGNLVAFEPAG